MGVKLYADALTLPRASEASFGCPLMLSIFQ
jgi:hypothetical protein